MVTKINRLINTQVSISPLITFRVLFGLLMCVSLIRFWSEGWIQDQFITPTFHFKYYGFSWVPGISESLVYPIFVLLIVCSFFIALGLFYRVATVLFFLIFTYLELIDATNYLNHYYFVSLISFLLIFLSAGKSYSLDNLIFKRNNKLSVRAWEINLIKLQLGLLYFFAGLAKLNASWLLEAQPMTIWLSAKTDTPIIGNLFKYSVTPYLFSWAGAIFDLSIFFFLIIRKTRTLAYVAVVCFHLLTWFLFPIGMFPFFMIAFTTIFFSAKFHEQFFPSNTLSQSNKEHLSNEGSSKLKFLLGIYLVIQIILPLRFMAYPGDVFWTEEGYRFSWRVMLMEKAGYATFYLHDQEKGRIHTFNNQDYLTPNQEKMMSTQPDFILQFAHYLKGESNITFPVEPELRAEVYISLNGAPSTLYFDPTIDLGKIEDSFKHKTWLYPKK